MRILKYFFFLVLMLVIGGSIYVATLKSSFNIFETRLINAPIDVVFNHVNELKTWKNWGPWYEDDSTIVAAYPNNTEGVNASFSWTGKDGDGSIETVSIIPNKEILQKAYLKPDKPTDIYWKFEKKDENVQVTWGMKGKHSFFEKAYWKFQGGIEKSIHHMYKRGLELLEKSVINNMNKHAVEYKNEVEIGGGFYLYQITSCPISEAGNVMRNSFQEILSFMKEHNIIISGKPFSINHEIDIEKQIVQFSTCIPVKERIAPGNKILTGYLAPQKAYKAIFNGHYKFLATTWPQIYNTLFKNGFSPIKKGYSIEVYSIGPNDSSNPADWMTEIYIPLKE